MSNRSLIALLLGVLMSVTHAGSALQIDSVDRTTITCFAADTPIWSSNGFIPIELIQTGDRAVDCTIADIADEHIDNNATDTALDGSNGPAACPEQWREIELTLPKERGSQDIITIRLLRTVSWLRQQESWPDTCGCSGRSAEHLTAAALEADDAQDLIGKQLYFVLPEMGAAGWGTVRSIKPCPPIAPGPGRIVTATFRTPNQPLVEVRFVGQADTIACTPGHPFLSLDRLTFVPAAELADGEAIAALSGTAVVESVELDPSRLANSRATVYNIEVGGVHRYAVGGAGVVVHNAGPCEHLVRDATGKVHGELPPRLPRKMNREDLEILTKELEGSLAVRKAVTRRLVLCHTFRLVSR